MRLDSLTFDALAIDLALPAEVPWVVGRTFNQVATSNGPQGYNWFQVSQPEIVFYDTTGTSSDLVMLVYGNDRYAEFKYDSASGGSDYYKGINGANGVFKYTAGSGGAPDAWVYYNAEGTTATFFGAGGSDTRAAWQLWKIEDAAGNVAFAGHATTATTAVTSGFNTDGTLALAYDSAGRKFTYTYTSVAGTSRLTQVKAEVNTGSWVEVGRADYDYYSTTETVSSLKIGQAGDLKTVTRTTPLTDSGVSLTAKTHYRYYVDAYTDADGKRGAAHQLRMVIDPEGYRNYDYAGAADSLLDDDTVSASDDTLKPYASAYLEYVSGGTQINKFFFNGQCGCGGGSGTGTYERIAYLDWDDAIDYDHTQTRRVVIKQPDGKYRTQYFDNNGQPLSRIITTTDPSSSVATRWTDEVTRSSDGAVKEVLPPEINTGYDHTAKTFTHSGTGVTIYPKMVSSGTLQGFTEATRKHTAYTATPDSSASYTQARRWLSTVPKFELVASGVGVERPTVEKFRAYHTAGTGIDTSANYDETTIATTFWSGTATNILSIVPKVVTTTYPAVATGKNGSNSATSQSRYIRKDGTTAFTVSPTGVWTYTQYNSSGRLTKRIDDAQTNHATDFASGDDPNTDFGITESGTGARVITTYAYDQQGRMDTVTGADGLISKMYYSRLKDGRMVTISCPRMTTSGTTTYYGPMSYTVTNLAGKAEFSGTIAITLSGITTATTGWIDETDGDPITALDIGTLARMSTSIHSSDGTRLNESRMYHTIPASGAGSSGTNYDATAYGYDDMGRQRRVKNPAGTITRTVYDDLGQVTARWLGTNDNSFTGGESSGTDNMVKVEETEYDGGSSNKNSRVTKRTQFIQDSTTDRRDTTYAYDSRGRLILTTSPQAPHSVIKYDNLDRVIAAATYSSSSGLSSSTDPESTTSNRISLSKTLYDEKGQVYETRAYQIVQSTGAIATSGGDVYLPSLTWYDEAGRVIKTRGTSLSKMVYDRLGRVLDRYTLAKDNDTAYADAVTVTGDTVLEESHTYYQDATGLVLFTHSVQRNHDDTTTTGALDSNADNDRAKVTAANVKGRVSIAASYYDAWRRLTDTAAYGTNAIKGDGVADTGADYTRASTAPSRADTILVTTTAYDTDGTVLDVTDPRNLKVRTLYDKAGRKTADIRNFAANATPIATANRDYDLFTRYTYSAGRMTEMWVDLDGDNTKDADDQITTYTYGVTKGTSAGDSKLSSNDLLQKVAYPDSTGGSDVVTFAYNAQGQEVWKKDQAGNVIETDYDTLGRKTQTRATTIISGFDATVKRIGLTYLSRGLVDKVTQYDNATVGSGSVLNEVGYEYDDWGNTSKFLQDRDSAITTSGGHNEAQVAWGYSAIRTSDGTGRARVQRDTMTLPKTLGVSDGPQVKYVYNDTTLNDAAGRVERIQIDGTDLVTYQYVGAGTLVGTNLKTATADTVYRLHDGTSGAGYTGYLDRFGRETRSQWQKLLGTPEVLYDVTLMYDRNGNITSADDTVTAAGAGYDAKYLMDDLNRLVDADEGTLSSGSISSRTRRESWSTTIGGTTGGLSQTGNWSRRKLDLDGNGTLTGTGELDDTGTFNTANEWQTRDTDSNSTTNFTLTHDAVGNMTDDGKDYQYVYDAFGRLVTVKKRTSPYATVAEYGYDGLGQRITYHADEDGDGTVESSDDDPKYNFVFDDLWRIVATYRLPYTGTMDTTPKETFIWHAAGLDGRGDSSYIDSVILRDRDNSGGGGSWTNASDGVLEERLFYGQNWRADVSIVMNTNGRPLERVKYSAYGVPMLLSELDFNGDGLIDPDDSADFINAATDWDLDGSPANEGDSADMTAFGADASKYGGTLGRGCGSLEPVGNRLGYAGYVGDRFIAGAGGTAGPADAGGGGQGYKWHVRHRVLDSGIGRWTRRDPIGYVDGMGLYEYVNGRAATTNDASGLIPPLEHRRIADPCPFIFGFPQHDTGSGVELRDSGQLASRRLNTGGDYFQLFARGYLIEPFPTEVALRGVALVMSNLGTAFNVLMATSVEPSAAVTCNERGIIRVNPSSRPTAVSQQLRDRGLLAVGIVPRYRYYDSDSCVTIDADIVAEWSRTVPTTTFQVQAAPWGVGAAASWTLGVPSQQLRISNAMVSINLCCSDCERR